MVTLLDMMMSANSSWQLHTGSQDLDPKEQPLKFHNTITYYTYYTSKHWSVNCMTWKLRRSWVGQVFPCAAWFQRSIVPECPRQAELGLKSFDRKRKIMKDTQGVASTSPWQLYGQVRKGRRWQQAQDFKSDADADCRKTMNGYNR